VPVALDIRADMQGALDKLALHKRSIEAAASSAINRTLTTVRQAAMPDLRTLYPGLKVGALKGRAKLVKATRAKLTGRVIFRGSRIPMLGNFGMKRIGRFGVRWTSLPWKVETISGETVGQEWLQRAFVNKLKRGDRNAILVRVGNKRLPITVLVAPGLAEAVVARGILSAMNSKGSQVFRTNFARELAFRVKKANSAS
jgi:hypothetical protein